MPCEQELRRRRLSRRRRPSSSSMVVTCVRCKSAKPLTRARLFCLHSQGHHSRPTLTPPALQRAARAALGDAGRSTRLPLQSTSQSVSVSRRPRQNISVCGRGRSSSATQLRTGSEQVSQAVAGLAQVARSCTGLFTVPARTDRHALRIDRNDGNVCLCVARAFSP